ncbi:Mu transposase C-terminal domain-containing protein [Pseudomonas arsenicoxydans]|uniref:Transposase n=1 Tax=Pseudomonas arsenicoxydans TaxID=702115 RepID=A0A4P6G263_9PSED|nr:Mu transposase C-terminal domain-containing protein [Pseudomonas arsenicoxydans]QAY83350.1 transposase [Pseudomonas arsenicoxydans]
MVNFLINYVLVPVLESSIAKTILRIIDTDNHSGQLLVISLEHQLKKPWVVGFEEVSFELEQGILRMDQDVPAAYMLKPEDELSEKEKSSRETSWRLIRELVEGKNAGDLFIDGEFGKRVADHAAVSNTSRAMIYKLLYRYWAYGQSKNVFLWQSSNWGAPGKRKIYKDDVQPGRPPLYRGVVKADRAIRVTDFDLTCIEVAFLRYVNKKEGSVQKAFDWMVKNYYREVLSDGTIGDVKRGKHPTITQFRHYSKLYFDRLAILKSQAGEIRWLKDHRAIKGSAVDGLVGPTHRYEIDATIADIYLVHRINRNWIIGRPVLYIVVDAYSRMIVGVHVGLEGPSWEGARHALYNAFTSKVEYCKRYGIEIDEKEWPCHHIPKEVSADRAELLSNAGEEFSNTLDVILKIAPPYRPDWKSIVESRFKLINQGLSLKFLPGGVDARRNERGDRDYQLDARYDLDQFTAIIINQILYHNATLHLPHLATNDMVRDEIELYPIGLWNWGMRNSLLNIKNRSDTEIKIALLPSALATVRRSGIYFKGVFYTCDLAEHEEWFAKAHNFGIQRIKVWYDPNSADNVWIRDRSSFIRLEIVDYLKEKYSGFRLEEVVDRIAILGQASPDKEYERLNRAARTRDANDEIDAQAKAMKKAAPPPPSRAAAKSNKLANRRTEVELLRAADSAELSELSHPNVPPQPATQPQQASKPEPSGRKKVVLSLVSSKLQRTE